MASRRVTSHRWRASDEEGEDNHYNGEQQYQHHSDYEQLALRVAEIYGPPKTEAFRDKQGRIVGIAVKEAIPISIIITGNDASAPAISGCARFPLGTRQWQKQDKDDGNQDSTDHQELR